MEYVFLAASCICFSAQFIFSKLFQRRTDGTVHASMWSNILSGVSIFLIVFCLNGFKVAFSGGSLLLALLYGLSSIICTCASLIGLSATSVAVITLYTLLGGVILPFFYGVFALLERPSVFRWIGVLLLIAATVVPYAVNAISGKKAVGNAQGNSAVEKSIGGNTDKLQKVKAAVCCGVVFLTNGLISIATNAATRIADAVGSNDFLLQGTIIRVVCSAVILGFLVIRRENKNPLPKDPGTLSPIGLKGFSILFIISFFYALLNGAGNIFSLNCAKTMDASLQFPIISAACIVFSALIGLVVFKEKPGKGDLVGILLAVAGIVFSIF